MRVGHISSKGVGPPSRGRRVGDGQIDRLAVDAAASVVVGERDGHVAGKGAVGWIPEFNIIGEVDFVRNVADEPGNVGAMVIPPNGSGGFGDFGLPSRVGEGPAWEKTYDIRCGGRP